MAIWTYISFRADQLESRLRAASRAESPDAIRRIYASIDAGNEVWRSWVLASGGEVLNLASGEGRIRIGAEHLTAVPDLQRQFGDLLESRIAVGIGTRIADADRARDLSTEQGGRIRLYEPGIEAELSKAERPFRSAGFRHRSDGTVAETGPYHDIGPWLKGGSLSHRDDSPANSSNWESGFITHDGQFLNREEAARYVNAPERIHPITGQPRLSLDSQDDESGLKKADPEPGSPAAAGGIIPPGATTQVETPPAPEPMAPQSAEPEDIHAQLAAHAGAQQQQDRQVQQQGQEQEQQAQGHQDLRERVLSALKTFQDRKQELEAVAKQDPELYQGLVAMVQSMVEMARQAFGEKAQKSEKIELSPGDDLSKDLMPGGRGDDAPDEDFDADQLAAGIQTEMDEHGLDVARAKEVAKDHLSEDPHYYSLDKGVLKPGQTGRHDLQLPVGSQKDPGAHGTQTAGQVKVQDPETGETKWRSVRAGLVMDPQGQPTSSRHPSGNK